MVQGTTPVRATSPVRAMSRQFGYPAAPTATDAATTPDSTKGGQA